MNELKNSISAWRGRPAIRALTLVMAAAMAMAPMAAAAQQRRGVPIIRDAEIEQLLRDYTNAVLRSAGLAKQNVQVVIINDRSFNAFVMDGRRIFVNAGALLDSQTPNQIIGVLAHEAGHIAGGHLSRLRQELANAQTASVIALILAGAAIAAGAATNSPGTGQIGAAALTAPQEMIRRSLLAYQRVEEQAADRAAVKYLSDTGQSSRGMYETFKRLADQMMFVTRQLDPYAQSHPLPAERVIALEELAKKTAHWDKKDSPELQLRHDLMRAKLAGFLDRPDAIARRYPNHDQSLPSRYARAISTYKHGDIRSAVTQIESLLQAQPNNPFFWELKGQALMENGRAQEALAPLRKALAMAPNENLIKTMLGQALVATNDAKLAEEAISILRTSVIRDPDLPDGFRQLAMAYGRKGDLAQADLASAQAAFASGEFKTARELAARARTRFAEGTPGWVKADDIVSFKPPKPPLGSR